MIIISFILFFLALTAMKSKVQCLLMHFIIPSIMHSSVPSLVRQFIPLTALLYRQLPHLLQSENPHQTRRASLLHISGSTVWNSVLLHVQQLKRMLFRLRNDLYCVEWALNSTRSLTKNTVFKRQQKSHFLS